MGQELINGLMEENILVNGLMVKWLLKMELFINQIKLIIQNDN